MDGLISLGVVASSIAVAAGLNVADPLIGLLITIVILQITWQSFETIGFDAQHGKGHPEN